MAMQTYLATLGAPQGRLHRSLGRNAEGKPIYIGGVLGLLERNTMRYYLAIDAYLAAYSLPAGRAVREAHPRVVREHRALRRRSSTRWSRTSTWR